MPDKRWTVAQRCVSRSEGSRCLPDPNRSRQPRLASISSIEKRASGGENSVTRRILCWQNILLLSVTAALASQAMSPGVNPSQGLLVRVHPYDFLRLAGNSNPCRSKSGSSLSTFSRRTVRLDLALVEQDHSRQSSRIISRSWLATSLAAR